LPKCYVTELQYEIVESFILDLSLLLYTALLLKVLSLVYIHVQNNTFCTKRYPLLSHIDSILLILCFVVLLLP